MCRLGPLGAVQPDGQHNCAGHRGFRRSRGVQPARQHACSSPGARCL